jgi:hypothetical protein
MSTKFIIRPLDIRHDMDKLAEFVADAFADDWSSAPSSAPRNTVRRYVCSKCTLKIPQPIISTAARDLNIMTAPQS